MIETLDVVSGRRKAKTREDTWVGPYCSSHSPPRGVNPVNPRLGQCLSAIDPRYYRGKIGQHRLTSICACTCQCMCHAQRVNVVSPASQLRWLTKLSQSKFSPMTPFSSYSLSIKYFPLHSIHPCQRNGNGVYLPTCANDGDTSYSHRRAA